MYVLVDFPISACKSKVFFRNNQKNTLLFYLSPLTSYLLPLTSNLYSLLILQVDYETASLAGGEDTLDDQHLVFGIFDGLL